MMMTFPQVDAMGKIQTLRQATNNGFNQYFQSEILFA